MTNIFILAAQRSAIGSYGGSLKDTPPIDLAIPVAKDAIDKSGVPADAIQHAIYGHVIHTEPRDMYSPRCISIGAGLAETAPAFQVNRLCGSGLQAIVSATQLIQLGDCDAALAGGVEVMSRGAYILPAQRWGARMGDAAVVDRAVQKLPGEFDFEPVRLRRRPCTCCCPCQHRRRGIVRGYVAGRDQLARKE